LNPILGKQNVIVSKTENMQDPSEENPRFNYTVDTPTKALESVQMMLRSSSSIQPHFPPTLLYNEGWLLRLVLDWFARHSVQDHALSFAAGARWFSEALLPSAFLARYRGDKLAESWTHADGVAGHFLIGEEGKADLKLLPEATQFLVLEAKMFSALSTGVTHAGYYDQAARNVACMTEVLRRAERHPSDLNSLGFYLLAPSSQIERGVFSKVVNKESILKKVSLRVQAYEGEREWWYEEWYRPTWERINIQCLSWEEIIAFILERDSSAGASIDLFFEFCCRFGR
jgi:hypothetical protein